VRNPHFSDRRIALEKNSQLSAIRGIEDHSSAYAMQMARTAIYDRHPYGLGVHGNETALRFVDSNRLEEQYAQLIRPESMVIVVVGDVQADALHQLVLAQMGDWTMGGEKRPSTPATFYTVDHLDPVLTLLKDQRYEVPKDRTQSALVVAYPTCEVTDPDQDVLDVLQAITGGLGGSFFEEIRGRRGLAYQVSTVAAPRALGGFFGTFVACTPDSAEVVESLVQSLCTGLAQDPPSQEELERAQNYLVGSYQIGLQTHAAVSGILAYDELLGLDNIDEYPGRIRAVTREDLRRVAQTYFQDRTYGVGMVQGSAGAAAEPR